MSRSSWFLVSYDVREPQRLRRVGGLMRGYGDRIQYSVFRCRMSERQKQRMLWELSMVMRPEDALIVVPLCEKCCRRVEIKGSGTWPDDLALVVL